MERSKILHGAIAELTLIAAEYNDRVSRHGLAAMEGKSGIDQVIEWHMLGAAAEEAKHRLVRLLEAENSTVTGDA